MSDWLLRNGGRGSARGAYSQSFSAGHKSYRETSRLRPCSGQCTIVGFPNTLALDAFQLGNPTSAQWRKNKFRLWILKMWKMVPREDRNFPPFPKKSFNLLGRNKVAVSLVENSRRPPRQKFRRSVSGAQIGSLGHKLGTILHSYPPFLQNEKRFCVKRNPVRNRHNRFFEEQWQKV